MGADVSDCIPFQLLCIPLHEPNVYPVTDSILIGSSGTHPLPVLSEFYKTDWILPGGNAPSRILRSRLLPDGSSLHDVSIFPRARLLLYNMWRSAMDLTHRKYHSISPRWTRRLHNVKPIAIAAVRHGK